MVYRYQLYARPGARNTAATGPYRVVDLSLARRASIGHAGLEARFELFNVFNDANFKRPEVTNLIFNFDGTVQSGTGDPRQVQLGLRLLF